MNDMEKKFAFGDFVKNKNTLSIGIVVDSDEYHSYVAWPNGNRAWYGNRNLELIQQPDTARLNWLEKQMLEDNPETIVSDGYNGFCTIDNFRNHRPPIFENIREAIDHEMKKQGN